MNPTKRGQQLAASAERWADTAESRAQIAYTEGAPGPCSTRPSPPSSRSRTPPLHSPGPGPPTHDKREGEPAVADIGETIETIELEPITAPTEVPAPQEVPA